MARKKISMNIENLKKLNIENRFVKFDSYLKNKLAVIKEQSLERGRLLHQILTWGNEVIYGHSLVKLLIENPNLEYSIIDCEYQNWEEAESDVVTYICSFEELSIWEKLRLCVTCDKYWHDIEMARQNKGKRTDLDKGGESKFESVKVNEIIAKKVGVSATLVSHFRSIYHCGNEDLKRQCQEGLGIVKAYDILKQKQDKKKNKDKNKNSANQIEVLKNCMVFDECEKLPPSRKASKIHSDDDYKAIVEKIKDANLPAGRIWLALDRNKGTIHVASKTSDKATGRITIKVDSFDFSLVENSNGLYIFAADFLNGPDQYNRKDESGFDYPDKSGTSTTSDSEEE